MNEEYVLKEAVGQLAVLDTKPNHSITFHNQDGKQVGALDFNGPEMTFTGDADESAKVFFVDWIARLFNARLEQERADEQKKWEEQTAVEIHEAIIEEREAISAEWNSCVYSDLEHGVKSLNEQAAKDWLKNYPAIAKFGAWLSARSNT